MGPSFYHMECFYLLMISWLVIFLKNLRLFFLFDFSFISITDLLLRHNHIYYCVITNPILWITQTRDAEYTYFMNSKCG